MLTVVSSKGYEQWVLPQVVLLYNVINAVAAVSGGTQYSSWESTQICPILVLLTNTTLLFDEQKDKTS